MAGILTQDLLQYSQPQGTLMNQTTATIIAGTAGTLLLPACLVSPILVLGCAAVMTVCIPFMNRA